MNAGTNAVCATATAADAYIFYFSLSRYFSGTIWPLFSCFKSSSFISGNKSRPELLKCPQTLDLCMYGVWCVYACVFLTIESHLWFMPYLATKISRSLARSFASYSRLLAHLLFEMKFGGKSRFIWEKLSHFSFINLYLNQRIYQTQAQKL